MRLINAHYEEAAMAASQEILEVLRSLDGRLEEKDCKFGAKAIPSSLKPYFISDTKTRELEKIPAVLGGILEKIVKAYFSHPELKCIFVATRILGAGKSGRESRSLADPGDFKFSRRRVIAKHIPWTRRVVDTHKFYGGRPYAARSADERGGLCRSLCRFPRRGCPSRRKESLCLSLKK